MAQRASLDKLQAAYDEQWWAIRSWVDTLDAADLAQPSAVSGWTVRQLVAHFALVADSLAAAASSGTSERPMSLSEYLSSYADGAVLIDTRTREAATRPVREALDDRAHAVTQTMSALVVAGGDGASVVQARRGPLRMDDFMLTRLVELTVHGDDLGRSLPPGPPLTRSALQLAVRSLTDVAAARAPGQSVELRVPPFAAVQCVAGPTHTRGTPPAVVETDALTWLRLAAGRQTWAEAMATGQVRASGQRADLGGLLPLLR